MEDLPVGLEDYRELAAFLEQQIAEASVTAHRGAADPAIEELRSRLARLHEILAQAEAAGENAERLLHDNFEADAFDLKMKRQPSRPGLTSDANGPAPPAPAAPVQSGGIDDLESLVMANPGDDDIRRRYIEVADSLSSQTRAADVLARVVAESSRPDVQERVGYDLALLYFGEGELPAARGALLGVVMAGANGPASLAAARRLLNLQVDSSDPEVAGAAHEILARGAPDPNARRESADEILSLHKTAPQKDGRLAVAYRALVGQASPARTAEALSWLRRFYVKTGNGAGFFEWLEHAEHWDELAKVIEADIDLAPAKEKGRLLTRLGEIKLVRLADANGAIAAFSRALAADPVGSADAALATMTRAHASLRDRDRHDLTLRIARALSRKGLGTRALDLCRELFVEPSLEPAAVQEIADIAHDEDDTDLYRHALEHLSRIGDDDSRKKALERLGDFQFAQLGDRKAAAESWRPAARMVEGAPREKEQAQALYERVLEAIPNDRDAAGRLAEIYAGAKDWAKLPEVLRVLVAAGDGAQDRERTSKLLLGLEKSAVEAGEVSEYVMLVDALIAKAPGDGVLALKKAKARALASDTARYAAAAAAHRDVIESSLDEDDVRAFDSFLEAGASAEERHRERRWLYERRVQRGPRPAEALLEWAKAEEEIGEREAAVALYVRLSELAPSQREGLEALCRLKLHAGDFEGGLAALRSLRDLGSDDERRAVTLQMARVLLEDLGRPAEAALALAPLLDVTPPLPAARQMMRRALADPAARAEVAESVEQLAKGEDRPAARRVLQFLIDARDETASLSGARRRWFERLVELSAPDAKAVLSAALRGAVEQPDAVTLWDHAERAARDIGQPELVVKGYRDALVERVHEPELAEKLGQRMVAFARDFALGDSTRFVEALQRLLEIAPGARWALDRVKLVLGSAARWDELFRLYDRAIEAIADDKERADVLDEAARAAKDVAGQPERAIPYLEAIHVLRPSDATVGAALERAYERQGRSRPLIALLSEGLEGATGFKRRETFQRIASLWLDLGAAVESFQTVEKTLGEGGSVADVLPCLERIAAGAPPSAEPAAPRSKDEASVQQRAIAMLREHFESLGQSEDVVRMASRQLSLAEGVSARSRAARDLKALLSRTTKLALEKPRRRALLRDVSMQCAQRAEDREHAALLFAAIFEEDAGDEAATGSVEAYGALLEASAQPAKLARLWEEQARVEAARGNAAKERECWERAAVVWRRENARGEAIAAYKQAAALDSESAYDGLAALHEESHEWAEAAAALEWLYARTSAAARGPQALRLAEVYVALGDRARARGALEQALEGGVATDRIDAVSDALIVLYRADGAWKPLADRLVANAMRTKDADKRLALLREAAELLRAKVGALAEAASLLEKAVLIRPSDPSLRPMLADVLEAIERWERTVEVLRDQLALHGPARTRERALCHRRLARAMVRAGRPKDALPELKAAAEMLPAHPGVLHDLARAALEVGQLDLTEATCRALLLALHHPADEEGMLPPHRAEVFLDLSEVAMRRSDLPRAMDLVDSAVEAAFETSELPERFEPLLATRGRYELLARYIERRVERAATLAGRAAALGALADVWSQHLGRAPDNHTQIPQQATPDARELEHDGATDTQPWSALAAVYAVLGDEEARASTERRLVALLESAIEKAKPGAARAALRVGLAKALLHADHTSGVDAAVAALSAAADDDPDATEASELLAETLTSAGKHDEARRVLQSLLSRRPDDPAALERLAALAAGQGDWESAIEGYGKALAASHDAERIARIASDLADACEKAGRPEDAREALERALAGAPDNAPLTQRLARICEQDGDWARLARLAETLRSKNPDNLEAVLLWAHALRGLSRAGEALAALTHALERNRGKRSPLVARLLLEAARSHLAVDEIVEAFDHLKAAYAMDARNAEGAMLLALVAIDLDDDRVAERALFTVTGAPPKTEADRRAQATGFYHLASMAHVKGDGPKARRLAGKALSMDPAHAPAQALLEKLDSSGSAVVARSSVAPPARPAAAVTPRS
jgi:tetratricopeptide (TPR) repeat protein